MFGSIFAKSVKRPKIQNPKNTLEVQITNLRAFAALVSNLPVKSKKLRICLERAHRNKDLLGRESCISDLAPKMTQFIKVRIFSFAIIESRQGKI